VTEAVFEILNREGTVERPETRATRRVKVAGRLKEAIGGTAAGVLGQA
jgi:hypothetical protein